jgi:hypothetical protein
MQRSSGPRRTANLSESIVQQLNMYALTASAAGVGMLALAQPSEARIVYTPANVRVNGTLALDLNHDGVADYTINTRNFNVYYWELWAWPFQGGNQVRASNYAAALPLGVRLGAKGAWRTGTAEMLINWFFSSNSSKTSHLGPWFDVQRRYLGLKFLIDGHFHYGWARLNVKAGAHGIEAVLTGYAYETIPNKSIVTRPDEVGSVAQPNPASIAAPSSKPATLSLLAVGSPGLSIWRRKESVGATQ